MMDANRGEMELENKKLHAQLNSFQVSNIFIYLFIYLFLLKIIFFYIGYF